MHKKTSRALWRAPIIMGVSSLIGLIVALLGDGVWDIVGWVGLGVPMLVMLWYVVRSRSSSPARRAEIPHRAAYPQASKVG